MPDDPFKNPWEFFGDPKGLANIATGSDDAWNASVEGNADWMDENLPSWLKGLIPYSAAGTPERRLARSGYNADFQGTTGMGGPVGSAGEYWSDVFRRGANAAPRGNPYALAVANQGRPDQRASVERLLQAVSGPSVTDIRARQAGGQNMQQAAAALAAGRGGREVMGTAAGVGGGLAQEAGGGRLQEYLAAARAAGQGTGAMRGADLGVAQGDLRSGLAAREQEDAMRRFFAQKGSELQATRAQAVVERQKLLRRLGLLGEEHDLNAMKSGAQIVGTVAGGR